MSRDSSGWASMSISLALCILGATGTSFSDELVSYMGAASVADVASDGGSEASALSVGDGVVLTSEGDLVVTQNSTAELTTT